MQVPVAMQRRVHQTQEDIVEMIWIIPPECIPDPLFEQVVNVPVPQIQGQVEVVKINPERVQQRTVEQIIDFPVPPAVEKIVEVLQERPSECIVEQVIEVSVP